MEYYSAIKKNTFESNEVDETGADYTERSKPERKTRCGEKGTLILLVGMQTSTATMENSVEILLKTANRTAL